MFLSIHQFFEEQAKQTPDAIAVSYCDESLSYFQLNSLANHLAKKLVENHVEIESRVGICLERSLDMLIGILAILKAGAAYVPLDPRYPHDRLTYMIQDAEIKVLICDSITVPVFTNWPSPISIITPSRESTDIDFSSKHVSADNAAYVIYTSGSTGKPKGCVVTHWNVVRLFQTSEPLFGFNQTDVWTLFHSFAFDFSVWEIWGALFYGGKLVIVPFEISRSPDEFLKLLIHEKVTVLNQTPSAFRSLIEADNSSSYQTDSMHLRYVIFGGEGLDPRSLRGWVCRHGLDHPQLINMYGITETTVHVTYRRITSEDIEHGGSPIGVPLPDLEVYLLNPQGEPVSMGDTGEIYVGGAGLARGYLNRAELTAARFVTPPFGGCPSDRLYRSGDLAQRNEDGSLNFLGRIDSQVKIRGHRIELGEIEAAILQIPFVAQAAVVARDDGPLGKILAAYIVPQPGAQLDVTIARQALASKLPSYMIPTFFVELKTLPLTINGKLDVKALPVPKLSSPRGEQSRVLPSNPAEELVASAWSKVLGIKEIGIHDNFFELGGHSLLAVRVIDILNQASNRKLRVANLLTHATVAELAKFLSDSALIIDESNSGQFLESIHSGTHDTHLVIVGARLRVPLELLPPDIPVWWLKLDGLHVWPPQHLNIPSQAVIHAQELSDTIPSGTILLCGHSYGGALAIEVARQLKQTGKHDVKLILLEPEIPTKQANSIFTKVVQKLLDFKKLPFSKAVRNLAWGLNTNTIGRIRRLLISARQSSIKDLNPLDRWRFMSPFLDANVVAYQLPDLIEDEVHLVKTSDYEQDKLDKLDQMTKGSLQIHSATEGADHYDIAEPQHSYLWMNIIIKMIKTENKPAPTLITT